MINYGDMKPRASLAWNLDINNFMILRVNYPDWSRDVRIEIDYDWFTYDYVIINPRNRADYLRQRYTDFDNRWPAMCFMCHILTRDLLKYIRRYY